MVCAKYLYGHADNIDGLKNEFFVSLKPSQRLELTMERINRFEAGLSRRWEKVSIFILRKIKLKIL